MKNCKTTLAVSKYCAVTRACCDSTPQKGKLHQSQGMVNLSSHMGKFEV